MLTAEESSVSAWTIRPAAAADLPQLTELYNHYVEHTSITFDMQPFTPEQRQAWFDEHTNGSRRIRLLVAADDEGKVTGYATTSRFRPKAAYDTTVEASVYCSPDCVGQGIGTRLYTELFRSIAGEDINRIVAGVTMPNPASLALHRRFGFTEVGLFSSVGRKFDRYWDVVWLERPLTRD
jgi:phosphinothricin acetyltransferase